MSTFEQGDIVRIPFPYRDRLVRQHRPALVVRSKQAGGGGRLLWVVMITSAENRQWSGDVALGDRYEAAGLPVPSLIMTEKIATIEARHAEALDRFDQDLLHAVIFNIRETLRL